MSDEINIKEEELNIELVEEDILTIELDNDVIEVEVKNYNKLENKPKINNVELVGDKSLDELDIKALSNIDIEDIINNFQ